MREIKFRGIPINRDQFIFGSYLEYKGRYFIWTEMYEKATHLGILSQIQVNSKTVGQYTGLKDKNGKEIYEGDKLHVGYNYIGNQEVVFNEGSFTASKYNLNKCKIIGNIHENPELLG